LLTHTDPSIRVTQEQLEEAARHAQRHVQEIIPQLAKDLNMLPHDFNFLVSGRMVLET